MAQIGDAHKVASLSAQLVSAAVDRIHTMLETTIDQVKVSIKSTENLTGHTWLV